jgi:hypothetical protein
MVEVIKDFGFESMGIELIKKDILGYSNIKTWWDKYTIGLFVSANDAFIEGVGFSTEITLGEIESLYNLYKNKGYDGVVEWVCYKEDMKPRKDIVKQMKKNKHWNKNLEQLPDNVFENKL